MRQPAANKSSGTGVDCPCLLRSNFHNPVTQRGVCPIHSGASHDTPLNSNLGTPLNFSWFPAQRMPWAGFCEQHFSSRPPHPMWVIPLFRDLFPPDTWQNSRLSRLSKFAPRLERICCGIQIRKSIRRGQLSLWCVLQFWTRKQPQTIWWNGQPSIICNNFC